MTSRSRFLAVRRVVTTIAAGAVLAVVAPVTAIAAQSADPVFRVTTPSRSDLRRAEQLEAQAEFEARLVKQWRDAATLFARSARLRGNTAEAVDRFQHSAWLFSASGDHGAGRKMLEEAAGVALDRGDAARGIAVLIDATLMAVTDGDARETTRLLQRTRSLLDSAPIADEVRLALRLRMDDAARLASR